MQKNADVEHASGAREILFEFSQSGMEENAICKVGTIL